MAGKIIVSTLQSDTDNSISFVANTGATIFSANLASGITTGIADGSITNAKLAGSITGNKIATGQITGNLIATGQITGNLIATGQITGNLIATNAISQNNIVSVNASVASVGTLPSARLPAGSVLQVVNAQFDNPTQVSTTSTTPQSTVLTVTITPKFATSKILVMVNTQIYNNAATNYGYIAIYRNNTTSLGFNSVIYGGSSVVWVPATNISYDSPATTSATTYTLYYKAGAGQVNVFWGSDTSSTITAMEIAA